MTQKGVWRLGAAAAAIALLVAAPSFAQTTGRIEGRALDSSGAVLPGATMTVSGPNLQGIRTATTDNDGRFRFLALPPGTYTVKAELAGFSTVEQPNVRVQLDGTVTLELTMSPAAVTETVTVTGTAPVIDVTSTTTGAKFDTQLFDKLPVTRNFQSLALAAPGVTTGGLNDAGCPSCPTNNPSVGGASAAENRYVVDGLDATDPAFGTSNVSLPMEFIQEVEIKTGGYQAEYGGALGGILNVLTKSGSNQFKGDVFGYYTDDNLRNTSDPTPGFGQDLGISRQFDVGADIGGKLIQDKLWFFAAVNPTFTDNDFVTRALVPVTAETRNTRFSGKLTWQAGPNHQIVGSFFGDPGSSQAVSRNVMGTVVNESDTSTYNYNAAYNGILSSGLFLKLSAGRSDQNESGPGGDQPFYTERSADGRHIRAFASGNCGDFDRALAAGTMSGVIFNPNCNGGTFVTETGDRSRDELSGALTWFAKTGSVGHELKFGTNYRRVKYHDFAHYPAPIPGPVVDETGATVDGAGITGQRYNLFGGSYSLIEYDQNSEGQTDELALFVQDQIKFGERVTLNLGLRFDSSHSTGVASDRFPNRELDFGLGDMIAPRLGAIIDVAGNGKSKLYGHWGRFYESVPLDINVRAFGQEQFNFYYFYYPSNGSLPSGRNQGTLYYVYNLGTGVRVQDGIKPMFSDETVAGFDYEIAKDVSIGIKGVHRKLGEVIEDISVDGGHTYFIANVGAQTTYAANPVTDEPLDAPITFPRAERKYRALEFTINKAFSNNWQLAGSYVLAENNGNYGGLFRQDNGQLDPNITSTFDLPALLNGAFGPLPNDRRHQFKAYGTFRLPANLIAGFYGEWISGVPISKLGAHTLYGRRERFVTARGSEGTTPNLWHLDLHLEYPIKLSNRTELRLIADGFNVTNQQEASTVDNEWTLARKDETTDPNECGGAQPNCPDANTFWGQATNFQLPRSVRFGVKLSW
jgi:outer membrane receptor protein involved in Fe transport